MGDFLQNINLPVDMIGQYAMVILWLIVAIIFAKVLSWLVGRGFEKMNFLKTFFWKIGVALDMKLVWSVLSKIVYFIVIFVILVWILEYLDINIWFVNDILDDYLPRFLNAAWLAVIAWFLATIAKVTIVKGSSKMNLNKKVGSDVDLSESVWVIAYWLIIVFFLPQILQKLGQNELLKPVTNIIDSITGYIPNIIGATVIFVIGLFIAKIVKKVTVSVLESFHVDKASKKIGLDHFSISELSGTVAYVLVLLPVAIQALDKLEIEVISWPATQMLETMINIIPLLLTALIIVVISYFIWRFIAKLVSDLLAGAWFDKVLKLIWLKNVKSKTKPSSVVWSLAFAYVMLLAIIEAANAIWFNNVAFMVNDFIAFATNIIIWIIILAVWLFLANLAVDWVKSTSDSKALPMVAKSAIIVLTSFMWLQQMWIGWDIITQAFTLLLWALAVAFALAVWLWSKDVAWAEVKKFIDKMKK